MAFLIRLLVAVGIAVAGGAQAAGDEELQVVFVRDGVFASSVDEAWSAVPAVTYTLQEQMIISPVGGGSVTEVSVRATHDGEELAVLLSWADPSADRGVGVDTFRDAAAIGFPAGTPDSPPSPFMGDAEHPVVIWQWAADFDANAEGMSRFGDRYPHSDGVWIFPQDLSVRRQVREWRGANPVIEYVAEGFGTLTPRLEASVEGNSHYADGRWNVVLRRDLATKNEKDASFVPGETTPFILAIWDGKAEEINGRKAVTYAWLPAKFDAIGSGPTKSDVGVSRE
ncbi:MAG: ethylbenzene dehydrogenase-related protein [Planctomycetota bacterium]